MEWPAIEWPTYVRDFFKLLTCDDCSSDQISLPKKFLDRHGHNLSKTWVLGIRNDYNIEVFYDRVNSRLVGVGALFSDFRLIGGELLLFESVDFHTFNVFIVGEDGCEIQYPLVVHSSQTSSPVPGWKFVTFISSSHPITDEVAPPRSFMRMFDSVIPEWFTFNLKNHMICGGHYEFLRRKLSGMKSVCEGLRLIDFNLLELLVLTYDGGRVFKLSLFDGSNVEIGLDVNVIASGSLGLTFRQPVHFTIRVMPFHMLQYYHGVSVPAEFQSLTSLWKNPDTIRVYKGGRSWLFEIKKRRPCNRTSIHGDWINFRNDMQLNVGDCCYFKMLDECIHHFRVEIVKAVRRNN